ncbi:sulfatase-like hydrolase/transferase [Novosphingobium sp. KCTC 2891]|uniref:sulfatase-like hydrolase/transferase n=1 Tax=Novosphingobium sp. KCTC 2891 TaxID=2989730 RepID=UPI002223D436|nr:sulfatase-like hydrolase/transferase [Novosphingobium sp. KCTC 2891]MCW1384917.1 sulfatase-like hydrolase/transferase [Novosphingobium sp. KCTC 2891]
MPSLQPTPPILRRKFRLVCASALCGVLVPAVAFAQVDPLAGKVGRTVAETHAPAWPSNPAAPKGAPNVIVIMTDDVGFGATSTFGGPVPTPAFDALGKEGLRYNRFNTTALCSPTRASLLTGRLPQNVNMGNVTNLPTGYDGYTSVIPKTAGTMAQILKENGYNTAMFGKNHLTPDWEMSPAGPYDRWPTGLGFEYFYGFMSADTSMWAPSITENTLPVEPPHNDPAYHFEKDMADHAIRWMQTQKAAAPDKPFFMYYAPGLSHTPHHAPKEWIDKFKGQFDQGWDKLREETFARQKRLGVIPAGTQLTPRPSSLPAWSSLKPEQKKVYSRLMEIYAATVAYSDYQTGRLIDAVKASGQFDNTLIVYIEGDNGSSAEGGLNGLSYEQSAITGRKESFAELAANIDKFGGPDMYNHFPAAWAWAMNAPFPYWKQVASQAGGVRNGMVMSWPARIADKGAVRSQYAHVSDIMPTVLEAAGIAAPETLDGVKQQPVDGISLAYSFTKGDAQSARRQQIYEMMENFGIYKDGWMAGTLPKRMAWEVGVGEDHKMAVGPEQRNWVLFNMDKDFSTAKDLSKSNPAKLKEMQDLFWVEAAKNHILPIHDWSEGTQGRPSLGRTRTSFVYKPGTGTINEDAAPHTIGHSFAIDTDLTVPAAGASGVVIAQGGKFGGYSLYLKDGRPAFHYNALGPDQYAILADAPLAPGDHTLSADFKADGSKLRSGGTLTLLVDGKPVASGRVSQTVAGWMSHTEGLDIGSDPITPVSPDYASATSAFTGTIKEVRFSIK